MPSRPTYPGVYIEEISTGVRTITGVATSITAFIGRAARGVTNEPTAINSFGDFERLYRAGSEMPLHIAAEVRAQRVCMKAEARQLLGANVLESLASFFRALLAVTF